MTEALHLRVVRPYATEEEFLEAESWTLNLRSVLLVGIPAHPEGTIARVELILANGSALVVAEGVVAKHLEETSTRPAGLVVRFRRMSAKTSEFIKRAVAHQAERSPLSSPLASNPSVVHQPPAAKERNASTPPLKTPTLPPSRRPPTLSKSSRPPAGTATRSQTEERSSVRPSGSQAQRASVIPAARRSTQPPPHVEANAQPAREPSADLTPSKAHQKPKSESSTSAKPHVTPKVTGERAHHDMSAMERLRKREGSKPITVPPNREAVLARLKKP